MYISKMNKNYIVGIDPRFAGPNPAEVDEFFSGRTNPEHKSFWRDFKPGVPSLRFPAR